MSDDISQAQFRATAGGHHAFGATPREAFDALLSGTAPLTTPIVVWPFNKGDSFFSDVQHTRLHELKDRLATLSSEERAELEELIEDSFDATIARTRILGQIKP